MPYPWPNPAPIEAPIVAPASTTDPTKTPQRHQTVSALSLTEFLFELKNLPAIAAPSKSCPAPIALGLRGLGRLPGVSSEAGPSETEDGILESQRAKGSESSTGTQGNQGKRRTARQPQCRTTGLMRSGNDGKSRIRSSRPLGQHPPPRCKSRGYVGQSRRRRHPQAAGIDRDPEQRQLFDARLNLDDRALDLGADRCSGRVRLCAGASTVTDEITEDLLKQPDCRN